MRRVLCLFFLAGFLCSVTAEATTPRGTAAPAAFRKSNACPSTKKFTGACPGWTMDHMRPLACNGPDAPENLMWQSTEEAKAKDRWELQCWRYYQH